MVHATFNPYYWHEPMRSNGYDYYGIYSWNSRYLYGNNDAWNSYYRSSVIRDYGPHPFVINIEQAAKQNVNYRTALWTGNNLQVTLMSINVGDDIGLEVHPTTDQFIRIEEGLGLVRMGDAKDRIDFEQVASKDFAIMIPAGKWHDVANIGTTPLKVYSIYAPPQHPRGTVQPTKAEAMAAE